MLLSVVLFGSRARGDHRMRSDVDLLGITDTWVANPKPTRGATMFLYDFNYLLKRAKEGDLFLSHIVHEGQVLHDSARAFSQITKRFQFRESYEDEIRAATAIIKFIVAADVLVDNLAIRKRVVWAMRTILIARAASTQCAIFSSSGLAAKFKIEGLEKVIDDRSTVDFLKLLSYAQLVYEEYGFKSKVKFPLNRKAQIALLLRIGGVAATTPSLFFNQLTHDEFEYH